MLKLMGKKIFKILHSKILLIKTYRSNIMQNAQIEHSAKLSTFIKLPFVFKTFGLSIFGWLLKTGFTV